MAKTSRNKPAAAFQRLKKCPPTVCTISHSVPPKFYKNATSAIFSFYNDSNQTVAHQQIQNTMTDSLSAKRTKLLSKARNGDMNALAELLESFRENLKRLARVRRNASLRRKLDTSDVVQEINIQVFGDFHAFRGKTISEFVKWIYEILRTKKAAAVRHFDTKKRNVNREQEFYFDTNKANELVEHAFTDESIQPVDRLIQLEKAVSMFEALHQLPELQQTVVVGHFFEGMSTREIAEQLGKTENAVRKTWTRALTNLGLKLGDMGSDIP